MNNTILLYAGIGAAGLFLYLYSAARNRKGNAVADQLLQNSIAENEATAGKTRFFKPEQAGTIGTADAQFGNKLDSINSKKIKRLFFAAILILFAYVIVTTVIEDAAAPGMATKAGAEDYLPYFALAVFAAAALYQLFLITKAVHLHEKGIIYKSLFTNKRIAYNNLNIIETYDTERRKPIQGWLFEFNYFNYDIKIPVYYSA